MIKYEEIVYSFKLKRVFIGLFLVIFNIGFLIMRFRGFLYKRSLRLGIKILLKVLEYSDFLILECVSIIWSVC